MPFYVLGAYDGIRGNIYSSALSNDALYVFWLESIAGAFAGEHLSRDDTPFRDGNGRDDAF